jgi:hypothetical protein
MASEQATEAGMMTDKYRVFYGVNASHTTECKLFEKLLDAKLFIAGRISADKYFKLYRYDKDAPLWDSSRQAEHDEITKRNTYRLLRGYKLIERKISRYAI